MLVVWPGPSPTISLLSALWSHSQAQFLSLHPATPRWHKLKVHTGNGFSFSRLPWKLMAWITFSSLHWSQQSEDGKWDRPGGWNVGSALWNYLDWKQVRCSSQRKAEVLHLDMRTDAGSVKAADSLSLTTHCTAQNLKHKVERDSLRVRGCSHPSNVLAILSRQQEVFPFAEKQGWWWW